MRTALFAYFGVAYIVVAFCGRQTLKLLHLLMNGRRLASFALFIFFLFPFFSAKCGKFPFAKCGKFSFEKVFVRKYFFSIRFFEFSLCRNGGKPAESIRPGFAVEIRRLGRVAAESPLSCRRVATLAG